MNMHDTANSNTSKNETSSPSSDDLFSAAENVINLMNLDSLLFDLDFDKTKINLSTTLSMKT